MISPSRRNMLFLLALFQIVFVRGSHADPPTASVGEAAEKTPYPRTAMLWAPLRDDWSLESYAKHDLVMAGLGSLGLKLDAEPKGLTTGFTEESIEVAKEHIAELRRLNPDVIILGDLLFYEYPEEWLPEDHAWWLRKDGKRLQFWPGTYRMDWSQADYREKVIEQTIALQQIGVDGVFYDNLRNEPEPWIAFLTALRKAVGNDFLVLANAGYAVGDYDFAAPFLNGVMYESGWSHNRTEWDEVIAKLRHTETLLRTPRISLIERFEEVRSHAGWPGDERRGKKPKADPAARRWSLCFSLIVIDAYYLFSDNTSHKHDWYPEYDVKIGQPVAAGKRVHAHAWTRDYTGGVVHVNLPGAAEPWNITTPYEARDSLTGEKGRNFVIPPGEGRVILRAE